MINVYGGSNLLLDGSTRNLFTHNSDRYECGAISCDQRCTLEMRGHMYTFQNNSALFSFHMFALSRGGALCITGNSNAIMSGTVHFSHNVANLGGAIFLQDSVIIFDGNIVFQENSAHSEGGGMNIKSAEVITISHHVTFTDNIAESGGAISIDNSVEGKRKQLMFSGTFMNNTAYYGGAVHAKTALLTFRDTKLLGNTQALMASESNITFTGTTTICHNIRGGITIENSAIVFENDTEFENNSNVNGGAINDLQGKLSFHGDALFQHNTAEGDGGAIYAVGTSIHMEGWTNFTGNMAQNGGAMYLDTGATLALQTDNTVTSWNQKGSIYTLLYTSHNFASQYGGGIYYKDSPTTRQCYKTYSII